MATTQNLERYYELFADATTPQDFFSGLVNYIGFILETPKLKAVVDDEIEKRNNMFRKVNELENQSLAEFRLAKQKLLKIIKKRGIDAKMFLQPSLYISWQKGEEKTILDEMEMYENGDIGMSGFHSDHLQSYLFKIAENIHRMGYGKEAEIFTTSDKDYANYYERINGDTWGIFWGNKKGNFVFSKSWPERFEQARAAERSRKLEPWGAFEAILLFWEGRKAAMGGKGINDFTDNDYSDSWGLDKECLGNIYLAARDFRAIFKIEDTWEQSFFQNQQEMMFLKLPDFKRHAATIHGFLLRHMIQTEQQSKFPTLKSIHLLTKSLEPTDTIWLVLNELFETPIRFAVKNTTGAPSAVRKLYDIAYIADAPNKRVSYDRRIMDGINNGIFKKAEIVKFMKTNKLQKPTLVKKHEKEPILVLNGTVPVLPRLIKNVVPSQYQSIYLDKTK